MMGPPTPQRIYQPGVPAFIEHFPQCNCIRPERGARCSLQRVVLLPSYL